MVRKDTDGDQVLNCKFSKTSISMELGLILAYLYGCQCVCIQKCRQLRVPLSGTTIPQFHISYVSHVNHTDTLACISWRNTQNNFLSKSRQNKMFSMNEKLCFYSEKNQTFRDFCNDIFPKCVIFYFYFSKMLKLFVLRFYQTFAIFCLQIFKILDIFQMFTFLAQKYNY